MKRITYILFTLLCMLIIAVSCDVSHFGGYFYTDGAKARMVTIGMDYQNSVAAPTLYGTVDDAYEMSAAIKRIMEGKNIEIEMEYLIQEGYDILVEVRCSYPINNKTTAEKISALISSVTPAPSSVSTYYASDETCIVRAFLDSSTTAETLKTSIKAAYPYYVSIQYVSVRNTASYPSKANIVKVIENAKSLNETDLLIMYYTGHGETYNVIPNNDLITILAPYVSDGTLSTLQYNYIMNLEIKDETEISNALYSFSTALSDIIRSEILIACKSYLAKHTNPKGALITAPYYSWEYYDLFDMERVFSLLSELKCKVVFIIDACYSGFASSLSFSGVTMGKAFSTFMQPVDYPNVVVMSASSPSETSKVSAVKTEEGDIQRHSMFTIKLLEEFNWKHSNKKLSYLNVPFYAINPDGTLSDGSEIKAVEGYVSHLPQRATVSQIFNSIMATWQGIKQTPQKNESGYEICLIP